MLLILLVPFLAILQIMPISPADSVLLNSYGRVLKQTFVQKLYPFVSGYEKRQIQEVYRFYCTHLFAGL